MRDVRSTSSTPSAPRSASTAARWPRSGPTTWRPRSCARWSTAHPDLDPAASTRSYFGDANQAGEDNRNVARMAVLLAGLPTSVPGVTVNRLCGSGSTPSSARARAIAVGDASICVAGGVESMSRAPWVMHKPDRAVPRAPARRCTPPRSAGGWSTRRCRSEWTVSLGEGAEILADKYGITREQQDAFALASHQKAAAAWDRGAFARRGRPDVERADARRGHPRGHDARSRWPTLKPSFRQGRHGHGGQLVAADRRCRGAAACRRRGRAARWARSLREPRLERRRAAALRHRPGRGRRTRRSRGPARRGPTWPRSSSTRRSPRSRWPASPSGRTSTPTWSTPTAARSRSGIPLGYSGARLLTTLAHELRRRGGGCGAGRHVHRRRTGHRDGDRGLNRAAQARPWSRFANIGVPARHQHASAVPEPRLPLDGAAGAGQAADHACPTRCPR